MTSSPDPTRPNSSPTGERPNPDRRLTLRGGGWIVLVAVGLVTAMTLYALWAARVHSAWREGEVPHPSLSNGFDLARATVPVEWIAKRGKRDEIPRAIVSPVIYELAQVDAMNEQNRRPFIVSKETVIGVTVGGAARAYPIRLIAWHETINDTLGGVPILVTYCNYSGGVAVYRRTLGEDPAPREFHGSGLVYHSNLVLYDAVDPLVPEAQPGEGSLWCQLTGTAIGGSAGAAGASLEPLPCALTFWDAWRAEHPETTTLGLDPLMVKFYRKGNLWAPLARDASIQFPVDPLPAPRADGPHPKQYCVIISGERGVSAHPVDQVASPFRTETGLQGESVAWIPAGVEDTPPIRYAFRFAVTALLPGALPTAGPAGSERTP